MQIIMIMLEQASLERKLCICGSIKLYSTRPNRGNLENCKFSPWIATLTESISLLIATDKFSGEVYGQNLRICKLQRKKFLVQGPAQTQRVHSFVLFSKTDLSITSWLGYRDVFPTDGFPMDTFQMDIF